MYKIASFETVPFVPEVLLILIYEELMEFEMQKCSEELVESGHTFLYSVVGLPG